MTSMRRFVILRHTMPANAGRPSHWDLMFELGESGLTTWAVNEPPDMAGDQRATQLPDHRAVYLDFEGPIPPDRGEVMRFDRGDCEVLVHEPHCVQFHLLGARVRGTATFTMDNSAWTYQFQPDEK